MPLNSLLIRMFRIVYLAMLCAFASLVQAQEPAPVRLVDFLRAGEFSQAKLSPDGKHVVIIGDVCYLVEIGTAKTTHISAVGSAKSGNWIYTNRARNVVWVTNQIFVVDYGVKSRAFRIGQVYGVDVGESVIGKADRGNVDSPWIYVTLEAGSTTIAKVNTETAEFIKIKLRVDGEPISFVSDAKGSIRSLMTRDSSFWSDETKIANWYRPTDDAPWEKLDEFRVTDSYWEPVFVPAEDNTLYVVSSRGRDTKAVFSYDIKKRAIGEMLAGHPSQDVLYVGGLDENVFRSVVTQGMKPQTYWFDAVWSGAQKSIDAAMPNRVNFISGDPLKKLLVVSFSDTSPATLHLYEAASRTLRRITVEADTIDPAKMRPMEVLSYKAPDGLVIPAYLTRPAATSKPQPTVVLIHGGPWIRDHWGWDSEAQILASRGYVVFQPQFRGSSGFGNKFREAGYKQWGLSMQDDITAGVEHLIKMGISDPERICIVGASYGGYAALWGLVKTPNLYRCGVSFAGVTDIEYMFNDSSDRNSDKAAREIMRWRIGDSKLGKAQFDSVSPLKHASRITAPVLLMHGAEDKRVPISHSKKMMDALKLTNKPYEWHGFENEGHSLRYIRSELIYYEKLLAFLEKHIGAPTFAKKE